MLDGDRAGSRSTFAPQGSESGRSTSRNPSNAVGVHPRPVHQHRLIIECAAAGLEVQAAGDADRHDRVPERAGDLGQRLAGPPHPSATDCPTKSVRPTRSTSPPSRNALAGSCTIGRNGRSAASIAAGSARRECGVGAGDDRDLIEDDGRVLDEHAIG